MSGHVLIVDDEKAICASLTGILSDEGYEVSSAHDGDQALKALEDEDPDLLLLDIWMPGKDGMEVLELIKKRSPGLPVIMISGHGTVETAVKATKLGAFDFIEKPLDMDKILLSCAQRPGVHTAWPRRTCFSGPKARHPGFPAKAR
jgi:two-component system nitrogen regulation response regulator NtrX